MRVASIVGQRFGMLVVLNEYVNGHGRRVCECHCDCGVDKTVLRNNLVKGFTQSCGCLMRKHLFQHSDLTGQVFGSLTALHATMNRQGGRVVWLCRCSCGNEILVSSKKLLRGRVKSCGCSPSSAHEELAFKKEDRFGRLTVLYPDPQYADKCICRCDCGTLCSVQEKNLKSGHTKSCGCLRQTEYRTLVEGTCLECIFAAEYYGNNGLRSDTRLRHTGL